MPRTKSIPQKDFQRALLPPPPSNSVKVYRDNASTISTRRNLLDDMDTIDDYDHSDVLEAVEEEQQDRGPDIVDQTAYSPLRPSTISNVELAKMTKISQSMKSSTSSSAASFSSDDCLLLTCIVVELSMDAHVSTAILMNLLPPEDSIVEVDLFVDLDGHCHMISEQSDDQHVSFEIDTILFPVHISKYLRRTHPRILCHAYCVRRGGSGNSSLLNERGQVVFAFYVQLTAETLYLPEDFMGWAFSHGVSAVDLTESFDANAFLSTFSTHSQVELSRGDYADNSALLSLQTQLKNAGLSTALRQYQLQGVLWMRNKIIPDNNTMDVPDDGAKFAFLNGWVRLTDDTCDYVTTSRKSFSLWKCNRTISSNIKNYFIDVNMNNTYSGGSGSSNSRSSQHRRTSGNDFLWYNLISGEIARDSELSPKWTKSDTLSCVLADEMGIGKSVQVLSLALLMKQRRPDNRRLQDMLQVRAQDLMNYWRIEHCPPGDSASSSSSMNGNNSSCRKRKLLTLYYGDENGCDIKEEHRGFPCLCGSFVLPSTITNKNSSNGGSSSGISSGIASPDTTTPGASKKRGKRKGEISAKQEKEPEPKLDGDEAVTCVCCMKPRHLSCAKVDPSSENDSNEDYVCLACSSIYFRAHCLFQSEDGGPILLIVPSTLLTQWQTEISKHIRNYRIAGSHAPQKHKGKKRAVVLASKYIPPLAAAADSDVSLNVLVYDNFEKHSAHLDARNLVQYDVILMSFQSLRAGYHESKMDYSSSRARHGKYAFFPPPFLCVNYSLVVIDESQNIESQNNSGVILQMAQSITSRRRLSVSGTPFGGSRLSDVFCLTQFLGVAPNLTTELRNWKRVLHKPHIPIPDTIRMKWLRELYKELMLRRTKVDLIDQLGLKPSIIDIKALTFSDFEMALYMEALTKIRKDLRDYFDGERGRQRERLGSTYAEQKLTSFKAQMQQLRKGCCHPQILDRSLRPSMYYNSGTNNAATSSHTGSSSSKNNSHVFTGPRPLEEIMVLKVEQARAACEQKQRSLLMNIFAMAGLGLLAAEHANEAGDVASSCASGLLRALEMYFIAWKCYQKSRSTCPLLGILKISGNDNTFMNSGNLEDYENSDFMVLPHLMEGISLYWKMNYVSADIQSEVRLPCVIHWKVVRSEKDIKYPDKGLPLGNAIPVSNLSSLGLTNPDLIEFFAKSQFTHGRRITAVGLKIYNFNIQSLLSSDISDNDGLHVFLLPRDFQLFASVGQLDTYTSVSQCTLSTSDYFTGTHQRTFDNTTQRSKNWKVRFNSVHNKCIIVRITSENGLLNGRKRCDYDWVSTDGIQEAISSVQGQGDSLLPVFVRLSVRLAFYESAVDIDALQELHACHNLCRSLELLEKLEVEVEEGDSTDEVVDVSLTLCDMAQSTSETSAAMSDGGLSLAISSATLSYMDLPLSECRDLFPPHTYIQTRGVEVENNISALKTLFSQRSSHLEDQFLNAALNRKLSSKARLEDCSSKAEDINAEILDSVASSQSGSSLRSWWAGLIQALRYDTSFWNSLSANIDQGKMAYSRLHNFREASGLIFIVNAEFEDFERQRKLVLTRLRKLSEQPRKEEIDESSNCSRCRKYFYKSGPVCAHCKLEEVIRQYRQHITAYQRQNKQIVSGAAANTSSFHRLGSLLEEQFGDDELELKQFVEGAVDGPFVMVMKQLKMFACRHHHHHHSSSSSSSSQSSSGSSYRDFSEVSKLEVARLEALKEECAAMVALWDRHSELLKCYDELVQCKSTITMADVLVQMDQGSVKDKLAAVYAQSFESSVICQVDLQDAVRSLSFYKNQVVPSVVIESGGETISEDVEEEALSRRDCAICQEVLHGKGAAEAGGERSSSSSASPSKVASAEINRSSPEPSSSSSSSAISSAPTVGGEVVILPCAHQFHRGCVYRWVQIHKRCPLCKRAALPTDLTLVSNSTAPTIHSALSPSKTLRNGSGGGGVSRGKKAVKVKGVWGTKVDALLADVVALLQDSSKADDKAIIFSQWVEMLDIVSCSLRANGINFVLCSSRAKDFGSVGGIESFKVNPDIRVLLLPLSLGAEGLDLIVANHVFLVEPILSSFQEAQAVNRIVRIGQMKDTFVYKYVVCNTIEQRISSFQLQQLESLHRKEDGGGDDDIGGMVEERVDEDGDDEDGDGKVGQVASTSVLSSPSSSRMKGSSSSKKAKNRSDDFALTLDDVDFLLRVE